MLNFTLTITAAPELLAALSNFTNSITSAKVVTIPDTNSEFASVRSETVINCQQGPQPSTYPVQQTIQNQIPVNNAPIHIQNTGVPVNQVQPLPAQTPIVPTSTQNYTMEQLAVAATQLVDAGRRTELVGLLSSFGVQALTALPKEQYGTFATQLRALGAKI
jgi:hypothetical protein